MPRILRSGLSSVGATAPEDWIFTLRSVGPYGSEDGSRGQPAPHSSVERRGEFAESILRSVGPYGSRGQR